MPTIKVELLLRAYDPLVKKAEKGKLVAKVTKLVQEDDQDPDGGRWIMTAHLSGQREVLSSADRIRLVGPPAEETVAVEFRFQRLVVTTTGVNFILAFTVRQRKSDGRHIEILGICEEETNKFEVRAHYS
jgi:hypothetical protein